ncbi:hypothetical protein ml_127 [Mollivirus sibericum]|uniref:hypothetical protein n=1 Tax=Mollivirus sibericum TaxID=1678078 RepID=UPI0006B2EF5D|nr:hypothetical protein ml_127 [Mollivirus sibericum]ALD61929.1 hypothetical protein ml_127 [Mollivirus sibericum]
MQPDSVMTSVPRGDIATRHLIESLLRGVDVSRPSPRDLLVWPAASSDSAHSAFIGTYGRCVYHLTQASALGYSKDQLETMCSPAGWGDSEIAREAILALSSALLRKQGVELLDWHRVLVGFDSVLRKGCDARAFKRDQPIWGCPEGIAVLANAILSNPKRSRDDEDDKDKRPLDPTWIAFIRWCLSEGGSTWKEQLYVLAAIASELFEIVELDARMEPFGLVLVEWVQHIFDLSQVDSHSLPNASRIWYYPYSRFHSLCAASRSGLPSPNLSRIGAQLSAFACRAIEFKIGDGLAVNLWESVLDYPDAWASAPLGRAAATAAPIIEQLAQVLTRPNARETLDDYVRRHNTTPRFLATTRKLLKASQSWPRTRTRPRKHQS